MKKRGSYFKYLRDPNVPIPATTLRNWARARERNAVDPDSDNDEQEDAASLISGESLSPDRGELSDGDDVLSELSHRSEPASQADDEEINHGINDEDNGGNLDPNEDQILQGSEYGNDSEEEEEEEEARRYQSSSDGGGSSDSESDSANDSDEEVRERAYEGNHDPDPERDLIYNLCQITIEESRLLIMSFALRFGLSDLAIKHLCMLVNCHLPANKGHGTWHHFKKHIPSPPLVQEKYYCPIDNCKLPISFGGAGVVTECECGEICNKTTLKRTGCYFLYMPVKPQIISMFKNERLRAQLRWEDANESDVVAGAIYKKLIQDGIICKNRDLSLQFNTDGVQLFKSSTVQLWPIQVCINELPFKTRRENIILCGLWYGDRKPNLNTFLTPFIQELNELRHTGLRLNDNDLHITKVHTLLCTVDSVARAPLQNIKTFRGEHGCSFCLNPGLEAAVGRGSSRFYLNDVLYPLRTQTQHIEDTARIIAEPRLEAVNGVKGMAMLLRLEGFHIGKSFVPDYLHCVLLGCTKTMIRYWTDGKNKDRSFYIGNDGKIDEIDSHMLKIKPPNEITRGPRTLHKWKYWRGHELKNFLLYYSIPCLKAVDFPAKYLNHWFLLVYAMSCFLSEHISEEKFEKGTQALTHYITTINDVYNTHVLLKFNTHLLLHVPQSVKNYGALWASSTFSYEHYNGIIAKMFRSSQAVPLQICKNYTRFLGLQEKLLNLEQQNNIPYCVEELLTSMSCGKSSHLAVRDGDLVLLGAAHPIQLDVIHRNAVETLLRAPLAVNGHYVFSYQKFIFKHSLYHVRDNTNLEVRLNCVAQLNDRSYLCITHVLKVLPRMVDARPRYLILGTMLVDTGEPVCVNRSLNISSEMFGHVVRDSNVCVAHHPESIRKKCILTFFPQNPHKFLCYPLVNVLERD